MPSEWMDSPFCPWCGDEAATDLDLLFQFVDDDDSAVRARCAGCRQPIRVRRQIVVKYAAEKAPRG